MFTNVRTACGETLLVDVPGGTTVAQLRALLREYGVRSAASFVVNGRTLAGDDDTVLPGGAAHVDAARTPGDMYTAMQRLSSDMGIEPGVTGLAGPVLITVIE